MSPNLDSPVQTQMAVAVFNSPLSGEYYGNKAREGKLARKGRVFVQTETGCVLGMELDRSDNAHTVKSRLQIALNGPTEESSLTFGDVVLKNDLSAIRNDSPLLLTRNLLHRSSSTPCLSPTGREVQQRDQSGPIEILAPNRIENGVWTSSHAPPEHRRVRSSLRHAHTRQREVPRARGRTHAPACASWVLPRVAMRPESGSRAATREGEARTRLHALRVEVTRAHTPHAREGIARAKEAAMRVSTSAANIAATTVMVDDDESDVLLVASEDKKSDWVLDSSSAYHLCRDREVFSTYVACEERIWMANNTTSRVVGRGSVWFCMADGRKTRRCCGERKLEDYTDWRGVSIQGELLSDMSPVVLARRMDKGSNRCIDVRKTSAEVPGGSEAVQERREMLWDCTEVWSDMSGATSVGGRRDGATTTRKVTYFAAHPGGGSYGGVGSETIRKDNLKISNYPPVGWRGRLLSPAHLDESKPTWMSPSPVPKPKPGWSSYGVSM
ncbi:Phosphatidylinositol 4-kinase [Actinidia chinensis var. chinensis]|uniref:1-phosphatidylinositol 4-kinase n=1 Tax=Actinidia chinensis var. chinensis TaxID=1590841 RepID=A0A2R6PBP3_ACTCC|nr:Phosphatidylinositol 4-kinase [Actinidia chinensis var. chinensis]